MRTFTVRMRMFTRFSLAGLSRLRFFGLGHWLYLRMFIELICEL